MDPPPPAHHHMALFVVLLWILVDLVLLNTRLYLCYLPCMMDFLNGHQISQSKECHIQYPCPCQPIGWEDYLYDRNSKWAPTPILLRRIGQLVQKIKRCGSRRIMQLLVQDQVWIQASMIPCLQRCIIARCWLCLPASLQTTQNVNAKPSTFCFHLMRSWSEYHNPMWSSS